MGDTSIDKSPLHLMIKLHENNELQVRHTQDGKLSKKILVQKGIRQGHLLAPFLFNISVNTLIQCLHITDVHAPGLAGKKVPILIYADDAVILSQTKIGLKRTMENVVDIELLNINYLKSKIIHFSRYFKKTTWEINGNSIDQISRTFNI